MRIAWCDRNIIKGNFYYGLCITPEQFANVLKDNGVNPRTWILSNRSDATTHFVENKDGKQLAIVCLRKRKGISNIQIASLLVHEAVHIWQEFCRNIGEHEPSDEFEAYGIQMLSQSLMDAFVKLGGHK